MTWIALFASTALFCYALARTNLIGLSWTIVEETNTAVGVLRDSRLDDSAREVAAQKFAIRMFRLFGRMAVLSVLVCAPAALLLWVFVMSGATDESAIWNTALSWPFIAVNLVLFAFVAMRSRKL